MRSPPGAPDWPDEWVWLLPSAGREGHRDVLETLRQWDPIGMFSARWPVGEYDNLLSRVPE